MFISVLRRSHPARSAEFVAGRDCWLLQVQPSCLGCDSGHRGVAEVLPSRASVVTWDPQTPSGDGRTGETDSGKTKRRDTALCRQTAGDPESHCLGVTLHNPCPLSVSQTPGRPGRRSPSARRLPSASSSLSAVKEQLAKSSSQEGEPEPGVRSSFRSNAHWSQPSPKPQPQPAETPGS